MVGGQGEDELGADPLNAPEFGFVLPGAGLDPAEGLFEAFAAGLRDGIADMACGSFVDGGLSGFAGDPDMAVDGDVRRDPPSPQIADEGSHLIGVVAG